MHKNVILMTMAAQLVEGEEGEAREPFFTTTCVGGRLSGKQFPARDMQRPGEAQPGGAAGPEVEMVLTSAVSPTTSGGCHASVPWTGKAVHSALGTFLHCLRG
ncbi:hypothetical protein E2C01_057021 [Portunus trituberculatus]|uniref:Uncharacterized protein n=1 Tax=Portunus trituberculatus TaxID=210409 RepID=A0A5B7GSD3_PORTR|nr:hypothetical protein [Portunus trituberculatus]